MHRNLSCSRDSYRFFWVEREGALLLFRMPFDGWVLKGVSFVIFGGLQVGMGCVRGPEGAGAVRRGGPAAAQPPEGRGYCRARRGPTRRPVRAEGARPKE